jgi:hypothetical protein
MKQKQVAELVAKEYFDQLVEKGWTEPLIKIQCRILVHQELEKLKKKLFEK